MYKKECGDYRGGVLPRSYTYACYYTDTFKCIKFYGVFKE